MTRALSLCEYQVRVKDIALSVRYCKEPLLLRANSRALVRAFTHILIGIIKAFESHEGEKNIDLTSEKRGNMAIVKIKDTFQHLSGATSEGKPRRAEKGETEQIGLPFAFRLFEEEGGHVSYGETSEGEFFFLAFPLFQLLVERLDNVKVLVVDDDEAILELLETYLQSLSCSLTLTSSPSGGLEILKNENFDLIIIDFQMPEMNGLKFIQKASSVDPGNRFILLTGHATDAMRELANVTIVKKPIMLEELRETIATLMKEKA